MHSSKNKISQFLLEKYNVFNHKLAQLYDITDSL